MTVAINVLDAYVHAAVTAECNALRAAAVGTRHRQLLTAARILGEFVGADRLTEETARHALREAAAGHLGVEDFTDSEVSRTITDGLNWGRQRPRQLRPAATGGQRLPR